jgi:hypothetical protein
MVPSALSEPAPVRVTVLPLDVVPVVGCEEVRVGAGVRVVVVAGRLVVDVRGAEVVGRGAGAVVAGAGDGVVATGTSFSVGCAAVSALASWMSRLRDVSCASVSFFFSVHAARSTDSVSTAVARVIYCDMNPPLNRVPLRGADPVYR